MFAWNLHALDTGVGKDPGKDDDERVGSQGKYGPQHNWEAEPSGAALAAAAGGPPSLQEGLRVWRQTFDALVRRYAHPQGLDEDAEVGGFEAPVPRPVPCLPS